MKWVAMVLFGFSMMAVGQDVKNPETTTAKAGVLTLTSPYVDCAHVFGCATQKQSLPRLIGTVGKWLDVSKENSNYVIFYGEGSNSNKMVLAEDYEVVQTHEICGSVYGYFMEKSQQGRYNVNFKGMRTSATFTFTTQYDAEHWVQKWCTPQSLLQIKGGHGTFARNY